MNNFSTLKAGGAAPNAASSGGRNHLLTEVGV